MAGDHVRRASEDADERSSVVSFCNKSCMIMQLLSAGLSVHPQQSSLATGGFEEIGK
jgi:hypothetical protein